jgi:hypothetical protein
MLTTVNSDGNLPNFSRSAFHRLFKEMGIKFVKRNRQWAITEDKIE